MKWNKGTTSLYMYSDEGYHICIDYLKRSNDPDEPSVFRYVAWPPHKNNPEYANDPYKSHLNAVKQLGMRSNQNDAKKLCEDHYKAAQQAEKVKAEQAARLIQAASAADEDEEEIDDEFIDHDPGSREGLSH